MYKRILMATHGCAWRGFSRALPTAGQESGSKARNDLRLEDRHGLWNRFSQIVAEAPVRASNV
jgi:hypothetical protein